MLLRAVLVLAQFLAFGSAADYEAVTIETKLPEQRAIISTIFDEVDSIYLLGGLDSDFTYQILKYSVTEESLEEVGTLPSVSAGSAVWLGNETIAYLGGASNVGPESTIWKTRTTEFDNWSDVGDLPDELYYTTSVWDHHENVYTIGEDYISKYDVVKQTAEIVTSLPEVLENASSAWDTENGVAYIFGGHADPWSSDWNGIWKFNPVNGNLTLAAISPVAISRGCAGWTGEVAYLIALGSPSSPSLLRFDPFTNQVTQIAVRNLPWRQSAGCAFVQSLNRMYIFGGTIYGGASHSSSITYIDLNDDKY